MNEKAINDPLFKINLQKNIEVFHIARKNRPKPPLGKRYKRDWYDDFGSNLNADYFQEQIALIWNKTSKLSKRQRAIVEQICYQSFQQTLDYYKKQNEVNESK